MDRQTLRDRAIRFNERGPMSHQHSLPVRAAQVDATTRPSSPGSWRRPDSGSPRRGALAGLRSDDAIARGVRILVSDDTIYRALKDLGFSHVSAIEGRQAGCRSHGRVQKNFAERVAHPRATRAGHTGRGWFQDEMRVGQKNKLTYRWARKGSRPRASHDRRTQSTYLFGAVCPQRGAGAALVLPACNTEAMQLHLDEISTKVAPGPTPFSSSIKPDGMARKTERSQANIPSCPCHRARPSSTAKKISGSSCGRTGSRTVSLNLSTTSSTTAATPGTP